MIMPKKLKTIEKEFNAEIGKDEIDTELISNKFNEVVDRLKQSINTKDEMEQSYNSEIKTLKEEANELKSDAVDSEKEITSLKENIEAIVKEKTELEVKIDEFKSIFAD